MKIKLSPTRILATGALLLSAGAANAAIYSFTTAGNSTTNLTIGGVSTVQRNYTGVSVTGWTNNRNRSGDAAAAAPQQQRVNVVNAVALRARQRSHVGAVIHTPPMFKSAFATH